MSPKSIVLVTISYLSLLFIFLTGPVIAQNIIFLVLEGIGFFIGLWAVFEMRTSVLRISAEVSKKSSLITTGPYRFIRHPMYASLAIIAFSLVIDHFTLVRFAALLILLLDLTIKINFEEKLLESHFKEYKTYKEKTKYQLIPFVY